MKEPSPIALQLRSLGNIHTMKVYQTDTELSTTMVRLEGTGGLTSFKWDHIKDYLEVSVRSGTVCHLRESIFREIFAWERYLKENREEYEQYLKLKAKYNPGTTIS